MTGPDDMTDDATKAADASDAADARMIGRMGGLMRDGLPPAAFDAGFADRTMARLAGARLAVAPAVLRITALQRSFRVMAAAAALVIVALGVHNTLFARGEDTSIVEAAIGLQPVSAASLLSYTSEALQ